MSLFTAEQLNRWTLAAEIAFHREYNCIVDRVALDIEAGTSLYVLDDIVTNIRRITYKGEKLYPLSHRAQRSYLDGLSFSSTGVPTHYIFSGQGQMYIKLFPIPSETLVSTQIGLFTPDVIREQCIVEFYAVPDGISYRLPEFIRKRLLKSYVLAMAFGAEGKGQNLKAAKYWQSKWEFYMELYGEAVEGLLNEPRKIIISGVGRQVRGTPPFAVLPLSMQGTGVDPGE